MTTRDHFTGLLPGCFLVSTLVFFVSMGFLITVALWANITRYDRGLLIFGLMCLTAVSGLSGFVFLLLGYSTSRGQTFDKPAWHIGSVLIASALMIGMVAVVAIKAIFPEMPE
jgi:hypothetical protein